MLDLAGALAFQVLSTAVHLNIFETLHQSPATLVKLTKTLNCQERGLQKLLAALTGLGYVAEKDGRYHNTAMTEKWFLDGTTLDLVSAVTCWDAFLRELWPHAPEVVQSGERPYNFYQFTANTPGLSHAHQQMMSGNANLMAPEIVKQVKLPTGSVRLLDVGGGHGMFSIHFCEAFPNLQATIFDDAAALETAKMNVTARQLETRIELREGDMWEMEWGEGYDLILLFNFIHHFDFATNVKLLQKAHSALKPGGQVAILDQLEGNVFGSATRTLIQLIGFMYYLFADGRTFSKDDVSAMLQETGFADVHFHTSAKWAGTSLVTAVKSSP
ncbi:MAG: methyltransferase domain-containing protein, partial [Anaerolineae bacterium]|nr:methyltransferase domain-containing protein [Anaerolineae bacterium]